MRTNLERYLATTIEMLLVREDGGDEGPLLDKLDELWIKLSEDEIAFTKSIRTAKKPPRDLGKCLKCGIPLTDSSEHSSYCNDCLHKL